MKYTQQSPIRMPRILIADDYVPIREMCVRLLSECAEIVAAVGTANEAIREAGTQQPDIVMLDVSMPGMSGLDAARQISATMPGVTIVFLSSYTSGAYVEAARDAGACGYVFKQRLVQDLRTAVQTARRGSFFVSPQSDGMTHRISQVRQPLSIES